MLFIVLMELVSRKIGGDPMGKLLYADDMVVLPSEERELERKLNEWNKEFTKHGMKINLGKTEVMWVSSRRKEIEVTVNEQKLKQVSNFVYLGGALSEDGRIDTEVNRRVRAGGYAWSKVEGVMLDSKISRRLKGRVLSACVIPACTYGTETLAMTDKQQSRLKVCENNWVRRITRAKKMDKRRVADMREEVGVEQNISEKMVKARLRWAGHVIRMEEGRLPKRALLEGDGVRRGGRPRMRWEDRVKKEFRGVGGEEWRETAQDRRRWKIVVLEAARNID